MNQSWVIVGILAFSGILLIQTLPVFAQVGDAINQGIDLSGNMISDVIGQNVPIQNAGGIAKDGFNILKQVYGVMRSVHHFITELMTAALTQDKSLEEAERYASLIEIGSMIATVYLGLRLLKGVWRHIFVIALIIFLVIIGASFLDNQLSLPTL